MKKAILLLALFIMLFQSSCKKDIDLLSHDLARIQKVKDTEELLREKPWSFDDLVITVKNEMRAIPLLANVADDNGMVQPGEYNSIEIFGNDYRQKFYHYKFSIKQINRDTVGYGVYNPIAYYSVQSGTKIRINPDSTGILTYDYKYDENEGVFTMTSDQLTNGHINRAVNKMIAEAIRSGKPDDISNAFVDKILGNDQVQAAIQQTLYDLIHNKLEGVTENPEKISEVLAYAVMQKLKEVDWESLVYEKVLALLNELKIENPDQAAQILAQKIAMRIETGVSQSDIYDTILPILQKFENEILPTLVPVLSEAIYGFIANNFSGEEIYNKIYPIWTEFAQADSSAIVELGDTLGTVLTDHFFDAESLATSLEPFIQTLRTTPTVQIPALAQDIIDEVLIPLVDSLNATFPGLELEPDWNAIKPVLTSALTAIKSSIGSQTNEEAAAALAESIIGIMDTVISKGVETAIFYLQDIPAEQAAQVIAAWVYNLVLVAEPEIVAFLEEKLNEVVELFNAEEIAEAISIQIHDKITEVFSYENIYNLIYPIIEQLSEINFEAVAQVITDWLIDLDLVGDNITEEQVLAALTDIISELIGSINVDEASQKLVDLILQSGFVQDIDGEILKQLIELKTYELLIYLGKEINAIEKVEISIIRE
jgi:hypothetical protein